METLSRLYELEVRTTAPHALKQATLPSKLTHLNGTLGADMRKIKIRNSQGLKAHEQRTADFENKLNTLMELETPL